MKKKAIEKIPYLTLPKVCRKKMVDYIGVTSFKDIDNERHLFLEVYRNNKDCKNVPVVRIVLSPKDFGTFFPETGKWSRERIIMNTWNSYGLIWREDDERISKMVSVLEEENVLYSQEDLERIKEFTKVESVWRERQWWEYIDKREKDITKTENDKKSSRKYERRRRDLEERIGMTPELPEQRILEYADRFIFHELHYLYYKKHGVRVMIACSKCGGVSDVRYKPGISYESQFETMVEDPISGGFGTCTMCGAKGKYMPQGRVNSFRGKAINLWLGEKYKEDGMVFRYIEVTKEWQLQLTCGEKNLEMTGSYEELSGIEIARAYFEPEKKMQVDYHKHNPYIGEDFWDDCNLSSRANITVREGWVLPETFQNMKGTFLQYSAMEEFQRAVGAINPVEYINHYIRTPQIEMLVKMGLIRVVLQLVKYQYGIVVDEDANRAENFLSIRKDRVKQLIKKEGDTDILRVMQIEKRKNQRWTDEQVEQLAEINISEVQIAMAMEYMTIQKLLNRISKYAGCEYGTMCSNAIERLRTANRTYFDYLDMRKALGYDMSNTVYLFPRDLSAAHDKMVREFNKQESEKRLREVAEKYPLIKKHYRRLRNALYYEDEKFLIRPARNAEEIVMEGRTLHHCVGKNEYLDKHNKGISAILFLRHTKMPEIPYITVEISTDALKILQWYGANDKKPDKENVDQWLNSYITRLKCQREGMPSAAAVDETMPVLAYA